MTDESTWTLKAAKELYSLIDADDKSIDYREDYISTYVQGRGAYRLEKNSDPASVVSFRVINDEKVNAIKDTKPNSGRPITLQNDLLGKR